MRTALLAAALLGLASACGGAEDEPPAAGAEGPLVTFADALDARDGAAVRLVGAVYADRRPMRMCDGLAESYPPQCGAGIPIVGLRWEELPRVQRASGVTWTDAAVQLTGEMRAGRLHVRDVAPATRQPPAAEPPSAPPAADGDDPVSSDG